MTWPETCAEVAGSHPRAVSAGEHVRLDMLTKLPAAIQHESKAGNRGGSCRAEADVADDVGRRHIGDGRLGQDGIVACSAEVDGEGCEGGVLREGRSVRPGRG